MGMPSRSRSARPINAMALSKGGDRTILPREFARKSVDFRLPFGGDRCEIHAVALEEGARIARLAAPIAVSLRLQRRNQRRHAPDNLPIGDVELSLRLSTRLFHSEQPNANIEGRVHDSSPRRQTASFDAPAFRPRPPKVKTSVQDVLLSSAIVATRRWPLSASRWQPAELRRLPALVLWPVDAAAPAGAASNCHALYSVAHSPPRSAAVIGTAC